MNNQTLPSAEKPLAGILILELSSMVTCAMASMTMEAQGATVIKVEPPGTGDIMRHLGHQKNGVSALFHSCNRGKQSLAIDLKSPEGVEAIKALAAKADIVMHNYRPNVMERLGLSSDTLRSINPRLIYIAVTGFGTTGPKAGEPAYDHVIQGMTGFTDLQAPGDNEFSYIRTLLCDKITAYTVCQAATSALVARGATQLGQHIDISMLHACLAFMWPDGMMHHTLHDDDVLPMSPMSDYYQTLNLHDGAVALAPLQDSHWPVVLDLLGYPELLDGPVFATMGSRLSNMDKVSEILRTPRKDLGVTKTLKVLKAADIPCALCERRDTIMDNVQIKAIGALETYVTETLGELTLPTPPVQFGGTATTQALPSPTLGEQSREILHELDWSDARIDALVEKQIVQCG
ncbi:MAG: CoA transferase [Porticoccaceae bacterium]|jgi:crotonobetainyl-CoA:carnitine CoA-transferase CaiB-like acyl-CoA transferase|nr:CoA transferase [Porticoccaceae bacterium]MBT4164403.1 CoA transferase [Porticoccaceae bacterium]MBT4210382.1 CoA transferase [Porticoccaceae bacterium]MBT7169246.1 CoA transferase [Porticoccaceae bacterium]